jgi:hypothetical protein
VVWYWTNEQSSPYLNLNLRNWGKVCVSFLFRTGWPICFSDGVYGGWDGLGGVFDFCIQGGDVYDSQMVTRERLGVQYF